jgi:hypothetical protein
VPEETNLTTQSHSPLTWVIRLPQTNHTHTTSLFLVEFLSQFSSLLLLFVVVLIQIFELKLQAPVVAGCAVFSSSFPGSRRNSRTMDSECVCECESVRGALNGESTRGARVEERNECECADRSDRSVDDDDGKREANGDSTRETRFEARVRVESVRGALNGESTRGKSARIEAWNECSCLNVFVAVAAVAAVAATPNRTS